MRYLNGTDAEKADFEERWKEKGLIAINENPHWKGFEEKALRSAHSRRCRQVGRSRCETADAQALASSKAGQRGVGPAETDDDYSHYIKFFIKIL